MNAKLLSSLSAALAVASLVPPAIAGTLGEHPTVVVAQNWNNRGIDPNTFIVSHPANTQWVYDAPKTADDLTHASESPKLHWSATIGTGYAARNTETSSVNPTVAATQSSNGVPAAPHWTATIGTGTAATSTAAVTDTKEQLSSDTKPEVAAAHWTSRIGSGHAFDSDRPVTYASLADSQ